MTDDRILFVPAMWAPDPAVFERWPSVRALLRKMRAFLPVDIFLWPTLKGQQVPGTGAECLFDAFRLQLRPEHHMLQVLAVRQSFHCRRTMTVFIKA